MEQKWSDLRVFWVSFRGPLGVLWPSLRGPGRPLCALGCTWAVLWAFLGGPGRPLGSSGESLAPLGVKGTENGMKIDLKLYTQPRESVVNSNQIVASGSIQGRSSQDSQNNHKWHFKTPKRAPITFFGFSSGSRGLL